MGSVFLALCALLLAAPASADPPERFSGSSFWPQQGRLGVRIQSLTPDLREFFQVPKDRGVLVAGVEESGRGAKAGLAVGDVILEAGGQALKRPFDLICAVGRVPEGESLELRVVRSGEEMSFKVEPKGEAAPWVDPEFWRDWMRRGATQVGEELRRQLQDIERRLEKLEKHLGQGGGLDEGRKT
ncbi:MAG: PDZ domain-containing protein [Proteobacteria bacterium]|nr:PDZ domain-containing protein [Pseudomonadota bacterium]